MRQQKLIAKKSVQEPQHMSFAEIVQGRDSNVRMTHDGLIYAVDLVMVVTGKNRNDSAKDIRNIDPLSFSDNKFVTRKLSGDVCIYATIMNYA
jgi:hypothetical protein